MSLMILKFGGSSMGDINSLDFKNNVGKIAALVQHEVKEKNQVIVVISASAGFTRQLRRWSRALAPSNNLKEEDVILAAGEQITAGLLAKRLTGAPFHLTARSLQAWQIPIETNNQYGNAGIERIDVEKIKQYLNQHEVLVVSGFQGVTVEGDITTLGFDGSDTTAVALTAYLKADYCRLYKDVCGVYTANPKRVPLAKKLDEISFKNMYLLAKLGANIIHPDAVKLAEQHDIALEITQDFSGAMGTTIKKIANGLSTIGITHDVLNEEVFISVVKEAFNELEKTKIIDVLRENKIKAEYVPTALSDQSVTIKLAQTNQLNASLQILHDLFFKRS